MSLNLDHLVIIPENPAPAGAAFSALRTSDGLDLRCVTWIPQTPVKGTVCLFQGRSEFIEKYFETSEELLSRGFAVATFDWRGQGGSQRELSDQRKGHVDDFDRYLLDLDAFFAHLVAIDAPKPWWGIAHSMGGAILLLAAARGEPRLKRLVMSAPMTGLYHVATSGLAAFTAQALNIFGLGGFYVPGATRKAPTAFSPFEGNVLTSDPRRYARQTAIQIAGPDLSIGPPTIAWIAAAFRLIRQMDTPEFGLKCRIPTLMIAAGADTVVSSASTEALAGRLRGGASITIANAKHEILIERDVFRSQFWAAFDAYIPGESAAISAVAAA